MSSPNLIDPVARASRPDPRRRSLIALAAIAATTLAACSADLAGDEAADSPAAADAGAASSDAPAGDGATETIKLGYVHPETGAYAGFTDGDPFMLAKLEAYLADGLEIDGTTYDVEIIVRDTGSDPQQASQLADELINTEQVDILLATSTPETVNPVVTKCEADAIPCITTIAPWQAVYFGLGKTPDEPFEWTHHFFFGLEGFANVDPDAWDQIETNKKVGVLWPNDADGTAFRDPTTGYTPIAESRGYTIVDPGAYENGTTDYTSIISTFKEQGVEIVAGVPTPPDFVAFWTQAAQQGYTPKAVTVGKALFFPATVPSIPNDLGQGLSFASWWGPTFPYESSLTGQTPEEWIAEFEASPEGEGLTWNQATPLNYALFEVAIQALIDAGGPSDKAAVVEAVSNMQIDTLAGSLDWASDDPATNPVPSIATIPTVIAQWQKTDDEWEWVVVSNDSFADVAVERPFEPLN